MFLSPVFTCLGHECQDLFSLSGGMPEYTDWTSVHTLIRKKVLGNGVRTQKFMTREKSPLPEKKISHEENRTSDTASRRSASPSRYQRAIPASYPRLKPRPNKHCSLPQRVHHDTNELFRPPTPDSNPDPTSIALCLPVTPPSKPAEKPLDVTSALEWLALYALTVK